MAALMIQGCGSDVGKSLLVAGLCRLFANRGIRVRPFKPQNMSNNAAVTVEGGEIGRAQALQARACRTPVAANMNPILLKPEGERRSQLIVRGRRVGTLEAQQFARSRSELLAVAVDCFRELQSQSELVIVEGAGSPAETNLRAHDIANMGFAHAVDIPVVLVGDISRGHVIAALAGAHAVLDPPDRARVQGFIVNKFRGDPTLFVDGMAAIERATGWRGMGIVPWLLSAACLPAEDAASLRQSSAGGASPSPAHVAILRLPHMANFDDFDPLFLEPNLRVEYLNPGTPLPANVALAIIPGTKSTLADLAFLRAQGWDIDIAAHVRRGGRVLGICGGYQMLGRKVEDPARIEGDVMSAPGLGLFDVATILTADKRLRAVRGRSLQYDTGFAGYEMHLGVTSGPAGDHPMLGFDDGSFDGALSADGRLAGCYVHGLFAHDDFRRAFVAALGVDTVGLSYESTVDAALDELAETLARSIDIGALEALSNNRR